MESLKHYEQSSYNLSFIAALFVHDHKIPDRPGRDTGPKVITTDDAGLAILNGWGV
jgi:hypothetical protein